MRRWGLVGAALASGYSAAFAQAAAQPTLQARFNQASRAAENNDCATALPLFEALAVDPRVKPGSLPAATIAVRRGICLFALGRIDDAQTQIAAGLPALRNAGDAMAGDAASGEIALGDIALRRWDRDAAIGHYRAALALPAPLLRASVLSKLAQATAFDGDGVADGYIGEALRLSAAQPGVDKQSLAALHTIRGRILLNEGRNPDALAEMKSALDLSGGLTDRVSLSEVSMRSDLAEAALLNGDKGQARRYLSFTGAGRIDESPFRTAVSLNPPPCGPETGLSPSDSAIVEFAIGTDGDVTEAQTVYSRGDYGRASAFARAVSHWYWRPEDLDRIPAFYRALTRVEVRCSNTDANLPSVTKPIEERFGTWAAPYIGDVSLGEGKVGVGLERLTAMAAQREAAGDAAGTVAALISRGALDPSPGVEVLKGMAHAQTLTAAAKLGQATIDDIAVLFIAAQSRSGHSNGRKWINEPPLEAAGAPALAESAPFAADPMAQDTLLLMLGMRKADKTNQGARRAQILRVADDARLPEHHPLRQVALLRLANLAAQDGDIGEAQSYFGRTGLTQEQCSLIGASPALRSSGASSNDYPHEALRYGFEGWVKLEFDIGADGRTANARAVAAYPPFVFVDAATGMSHDFRYQSSYRPSGGAACTAKQETVAFQIPL